MNRFNIIEIVLIFVFFVGGLISDWSFEVKILNEDLPALMTSMINGLVSSISVIMGFTGGFLIFIMSKDDEKVKIKGNRLAFYIFGIAMVLATFWTIFAYALRNEFVLAFKVGMAGLLVAMLLLSDLTFFYMINHSD